jgi:hypothetical protein
MCRASERGSLMFIIAKLVTAALAVALFVLLSSGAAGARSRLEVSTTAFLASSRVTFAEERGANIIIDMTLHGTLRRLLTKVLLSSVGAFTSILTANCRRSFGLGCQVTALGPMAISYGSIRGTLPTIRGVHFQIGVLFLIVELDLGRRCLYEGVIGVEAVENPAHILIPLAGQNLALLAGDRLTLFPCLISEEMNANFAIVPLITFRLLER